MYPQHYHNAIQAVIRDIPSAPPEQTKLARMLVAKSLRAYRRGGNKAAADNLLTHIYRIGYPVKQAGYRARLLADIEADLTTPGPLADVCKPSSDDMAEMSRSIYTPSVSPGQFRAHLDRATAIVKTWPEWKQNLLG